jgi:hypothetical protein
MDEKMLQNRKWGYFICAVLFNNGTRTHAHPIKQNKPVITPAKV